jgi:hypothetical protein
VGWICAVGVLAALAGPSRADAATASQAFTTFGEHAFVVPTGVTSVQVSLVGGTGGSAYNVLAAYVRCF